MKAVDFGASRKPASLAELLVAETLRDPGAVEIGYADDMRWTVALIERDGGRTTRSACSARATVFVITGAAGSIVSAITADLARASGGTFHLLDLVPAPDRDDADLERFVERPRRAEARAGRAAEAGRASGPRRSWSSASWPASSARARPSTPSWRSRLRAAARTGTRST